jgi:hypothetical protein
MVLLLATVILLTGCGNSATANQYLDGVYYSKIDESEIGQIYRNNALYIGAKLHYNDKIYTSSWEQSSTDQNDLNPDTMLGDELGTVSGNHTVYWSTDSEELSECTTEGVIYQVKGYDETFRVAIYSEVKITPLSDTVYHLIVFDCLNDVTMNTGKDLFEERLHLGEAISVNCVSPEGGDGESFPEDQETVDEFLDALYAGTFLSPEDESYPTLDPAQAYTLSFMNQNGMVDELRVYEEGYVQYVFPWDDYIVEVDTEELLPEWLCGNTA